MTIIATVTTAAGIATSAKPVCRAPAYAGAAKPCSTRESGGTPGKSCTASTRKSCTTTRAASTATAAAPTLGITGYARNQQDEYGNDHFLFHNELITFKGVMQFDWRLVS